MSIAWRLAQRGVAVAVFDKGRIGGEASWAGAGMLAPGGEYTAHSRWAELGVESLKLYPDFVAELQAESGAGIDFRKCGASEIAFTDDDGDRLHSRALAQAFIGIRTERVSGRELFYPEDSLVNPRDVLHALRIACERRGVEFREHHPVSTVSKVEGAVVIAAGAWSGEFELIPERAFPVRGHLVSYASPSSPGGPGPILRSGSTYIIHRANGITIAGSTLERVGFDRAVDAALVADIDRRARELMPSLGEPKDAWIGFRPATESLEPQLGRVPGTEVFYAYGHYRNGILLAPVTAKIMGDMILTAN